MNLVHQVKDHIDTLVIDSEIGFQVLDEMRAGNVPVRIGFTRGALLRDDPLLLEPEFQRLHLQP